MAKAKMTVKIKGSPKEVGKAIDALANKTEFPLREADFRARQLREKKL